MLTRRQLLKRSTIGGAIVLAPSGVFARTAEARVVIPRLWASACPTPGGSWPIIDARTSGAASIDAKDFSVVVHPDLPATKVWGYEGGTLAPGATRSTYLGPTVLAQRGAPVDVTFKNSLPATPLFPTDPALVPGGDANAPPRINTHLHGGRIGDAEDGNPFDAYGDMATGQPEVTPGDSQVQTYANQQGGTLLWYHDHALGITRTNVYAGLAGGYLLTEPPGSPDAVGNVPTALDASDVPDPYDPGGKIPLHIPLVIQDKDLDDTGQLVYPFPWAPEFFGTTCIVNGKAFPFLEVQPRRYRFTFLNGSQSRFYNLRFNKAVTITQIGVELGPLNAAQTIPNILLGPAERADVIVDFSGLKPGTKAVLADTPLPVGVVSPTRPLGDCMQFRVVGPTLTSDPFAGPPVLPGWTASSPTPRPAQDDNGTPWPVSKVTLEEVMGRGGKPIMAVVNGTPFMKRDANGKMTHEPNAPFSTEIVQNASTVEWDYINLTADSHPFHTHLAHFEVVHRQTFNAVLYMQDLTAKRAQDPGLDPKNYPDPRAAVYTPGPVVPAPPQEKGPKDTVIANPGEITRIRLKVDLPDGAASGDHHYVFHCHILEHEENEMMRPLLVQKPA